MALAELLLAGICINATCRVSPESKTYYADFPNRVAVLEAFKKQINGTLIKIGTLQNAPFSYAEEVNGTWVGQGVAFSFINYLQEKYHFRYTVHPEEEIFGSNGTGLFGLLANGSIDVAAAFLPVVPTYRELVRYSTSLDIGEWVVLMQRPAQSATGSGLLAPFTWEVWLLVLVSVVAVGPIIYFLIYLKSKLCEDEPNNVYPLPACVWFVYGGLLKQGSTLSPMTDSSRLLFATWWIFITILTAFYTANLTAFLTLSQFTLPIREAADIGAYKYSWVTNKGNAIEEAATNQEETVYGQLKGSKGNYVKDDTTKLVDEWIKKKNHMYIGEKSTVERMLYDDYQSKAKIDMPEEEKCSLVMTQWAVLIRQRAFAYAKDFEFGELFDHTMQYIVESGIIQYLARDGLPNTQICPLNLGSKERQLRNSDLILTYKIVGCGFGVSALIFILELVAEYYNKQKAFSTKKLFAIDGSWTPQKNNHMNQTVLSYKQMDIFGNVLKEPDDQIMRRAGNYEGYNSNKQMVLKLRKPTQQTLFPYTN